MKSKFPHDPTAAAPPARAWKVRVPCSTSNLGPGFDLLGVALSLFVELEAEALPGGEHEFVSLEGEAQAWPTGADNLVFRAFDTGREWLGSEPLGLRIRARSEVPVGRGLGSSGAAVVAGLLLAAISRDGPDEPGPPAPISFSRLGSDLDGHPDNATASLGGGCTLALPVEHGFMTLQQEFSEDIAVAVAWPASPLETSRARDALPAQVALADAIENPRRLAFLLEGLRTGSPLLLGLGGEDRLHVPYRLPLIAGGAEALAAAREAGAWLATISGSGSALIALTSHDGAAAVAEAMRLVLDREDGPAVGRVLDVVREAPRATRLRAE